MEILPGQLVWHPAPAGNDSSSVSVLELGDFPQYHVPHYSAAALGQAFGPFALDQIFVFCRRLKTLLVSRSHGQQPPLQLTCRSNDSEERTNSCVLLGAYLVLVQGWPTSQVVGTLGKQEAERKFMCSWQRYCRKVMPVMACWEGLEVAVKRGWIDRDCLNDDVFTELACSKFRHTLATFDASWLIPGKLLVSADPSTTVEDPNPDTFQFLWSSELNEEPSPTKSSLRSGSLVPSYRKLKYSTAVGGDCDGLDGSEGTITGSTETSCCLQATRSDPSQESLVDRNIVCIDDGASSVGTVCKEYQQPAAIDERESQTRKKSFREFLQDCDVKLMVRCNYSHEAGMPETGSYSADKLKQHGINHKEIQFLDKEGSLPTHCHVAEILKEGTLQIEADVGAVLVHCKGGFGRSVVLACCLAIHSYDISGRALLGWVRIARPGAIITVQQEEFLMSLNGRADVAHFAEVPQCSKGYKQAADDVARPRCRPGCAVQ